MLGQEVKCWTIKTSAWACLPLLTFLAFPCFRPIEHFVSIHCHSFITTGYPKYRACKTAQPQAVKLSAHGKS